MNNKLHDEEDLSDSSDDDRSLDFPAVLIVTTGLWTVIFAVFSFGFDTDPEQCLASNKDDLLPYRLPLVDQDVDEGAEDRSDIVDVAQRFKFFFNTAFLLSCVQLAVGMVVLLLRHKESWVKSITVFLFWLSSWLMFGLWGYVFLVRYMHSGSECSGDFIVSKKKAQNLLYIEGMFIKFSSLLVFFVLLLYVMGILINLCQRLTGGTAVKIEFDI